MRRRKEKRKREEKEEWREGEEYMTCIRFEQ
jgi:hypothetical protein